MKTTKKANDEREIAASVERGEWKSVPRRRDAIARMVSVARATQRKDQRVNIRISSKDLGLLQVRACDEGLPCQTLIASVLHKFANNRLVEPRRMGELKMESRSAV